ncbi:MAG: 30S ribosomal protein S6 [Phycisphaeraceae bacterium]|nr:30S ribosomal protein S6 [Phycisphaeraceae bacterium]
MSDSPTRLYEGLFMVSQAAAGSDFAGVVAHIKEVLARAEATVHVLTKWDERRLAYDIKTAKRGTYFLAVFDARSTQVANIERDCNLSETIVRALILRGDHIGDVELEELKKLTPAEQETGLRSSDDDDEKNEEVVEDTNDDVDTDVDADDEDGDDDDK